MGDEESIIERAVADEQKSCDFCFSTDSRRPALRQLKGGREILGVEVGEAMD